MAKFRLSRRAVLRGVGGIALPLPPLEMMGGCGGIARAAAGGPIPKRYCQMWAGVSLGAYGYPYTLTVPMKAGVGYDLPGSNNYKASGLKSLAGATDSKGYSWTSIQDEVGIVSGLQIPRGGGKDDPGGSIPPAGTVYGAAHGAGMCCMSAGSRGDGQYTSSPSADQLAADVLGAGTIRRNIPLQVQPKSYDGGSDCMQFSWTKQKRFDTAEISPKRAFDAILGLAGMAKSDPKAYASLLARRKSVIDLVQDGTEALVRRLGGEDKRRLQGYQQQIVDLEKRLTIFKADPSCNPPAAPGADPPVGQPFNANGEPDSPQPDANNATLAWSNETFRGELLTEIIAVAFTCNITNVASLLITNPQCFMHMTNINGDLCSVHGASHFQGSQMESLADAAGWHVKMFARLAAKLRDAQETDGTRVLDHTAMLLFFETGYGLTEPPQDAQSTARDDGIYGKPAFYSHSMDNMAVVYAGRASSPFGALKPGQHLVFNKDRGRQPPDKVPPHPGQVTLGCLRAIGYDGPLGEIPGGPIPGMLV